MPVNEKLQAIMQNVSAIGRARLLTFAGIAVLTTALIVGAAIFAAKPSYETLYVGLDRDDVNRIGIVLSDAGIAYDLNDTGDTLLVEIGQSARARMILAEKGLPGSASSGYELFDNLGSLGLTSFMQEVTRVRALEGEIARSIQSIEGVKAARVHIVMPDQTGFRERDRRPTASVLLSSNGSDLGAQADGIRQLVAAAIPSLSKSDVTVLDSSGRLLASGDDGAIQNVGNAFELERRVETELSRKIANALRPHIGENNYRVAVQADLDTDQRQTEETIFDPTSRVERSYQSSRTTDNSTDREQSQAATVEQNIPTEANQNAAPGGNSSSTERERRDETTNYEINTKRIATVSNGFRLRKLNVAILLNRATLLQAVEGTGANEEDRLATIRQLVGAAAGIDTERGDRIEVSAIEFLPEDAALAPVGGGVVEVLMEQMSTIVKAAVFLVVTLLVLLFGVRPMLKSLDPNTRSADGMDETMSLAGEGGRDAMPLLPQSILDAYGADQTPAGGGPAIAPQPSPEQQLRLRMREVGEDPRDRLTAMIDIDEDRVVEIVRRWASEAA